MTSLEEKGAKIGTFTCGTEFLRWERRDFRVWNRVSSGEKRDFRVRSRVSSGEKRDFRVWNRVSSGERRDFRVRNMIFSGKNLSLREMTFDKEKSSLTCKKTLAKKYKYDRI